MLIVVTSCCNSCFVTPPVVKLSICDCILDFTPSRYLNSVFDIDPSPIFPASILVISSDVIFLPPVTNPLSLYLTT